MKTATIAVRVDADLKARLEAMFRSLGITLSDAINIFLHKAEMTGGIPFPVAQVPNGVETFTEQDVRTMLAQARADSEAGVPTLSHAEVFGALRAKYGSK